MGRVRDDLGHSFLASGPCFTQDALQRRLSAAWTVADPDTLCSVGPSPVVRRPSYRLARPSLWAIPAIPAITGIPAIPAIPAMTRMTRMTRTTRPRSPCWK